MSLRSHWHKRTPRSISATESWVSAEHDVTHGRSAGTTENPTRDPTRGASAKSAQDPEHDPTRSQPSEQ